MSKIRTINTKPGSAILVVVSMLGILIYIAMRVWISCSLLADIATQKELAAQQYFLTQGLLTIAIAQAQDILATSSQIVSYQNCVPFSNHTEQNLISLYEGFVEIISQKDSTVRCTASLMKEHRVIRKHSCLIQSDANKLHISQWLAT